MAELKRHGATHPLMQEFIRMENRFMRSVGITPTRFQLRSKIYEVRNITFNTSTVPWNAKTRNKYALYLETEFKTSALPIHSCFIAEAEPVTTTTSGREMLRLEKYDGGNTVPPHVCWIAAWDSKEQADQTWAKLLMSSKSDSNHNGSNVGPEGVETPQIRSSQTPLPTITSVLKVCGR